MTTFLVLVDDSDFFLSSFFFVLLGDRLLDLETDRFLFLFLDCFDLSVFLEFDLDLDLRFLSSDCLDFLFRGLLDLLLDLDFDSFLFLLFLPPSGPLNWPSQVAPRLPAGFKGLPS